MSLRLKNNAGVYEMKLTKTTTFYKKNTASKDWVLIDADGQTLGRLVTRIADTLRGKNKATYTPNSDCGDFVVVVNAEKIKFTGKKLTDKRYFRHSQYISGIKETSAGDLLQKKPEKVIFEAVKGMLPKTKLSDRLMTKLKVYKGESHPHIAQQPKKVEVNK